jgi:ribose transport system ATP-binding protein
VSKPANQGSRDANESPVLLQAKSVSKIFNGIYAVKDVDFDLKPGEVHALLGPNGSGKSTLIKILDGVQPQDEGHVELGGRARTSRDVATVFQELSLIPSLSVAKNIFLGNEPHNALGLVRTKEMNRLAKELTDRLGFDLRILEPVENLSPAARQLVEIAKAIHRQARVLILDEPTSTLTKADQNLLFTSIREIQKTGVGIIYVTHRLTEVFEIADRVTVLRDGRKELSAPVSETDMESLVSVITGTDAAASKSTSRSFSASTGSQGLSPELSPRLEVKQLAGDRFSHVSLTVAPGRIVGIAGLTGSGRTELLETIAGLRRKVAGDVCLDGKSTAFKNAAQALRAGVALVPEDRHRAGIILQHSIFRNLALAHAGSLRRGPFLDGARAKALVGELVESLQVKTASIMSAVQSLSGGNQQKVVFAKWLQAGIRLLLLDEPTQGVDVGARHEIYKVIHRYADEGVGVLVVSSDFVELQELCDEIYFMTSSSMSGPKRVTAEVTDQFIYSTLSDRSKQ